MPKKSFRIKWLHGDRGGEHAQVGLNIVAQREAWGCAIRMRDARIETPCDAKRNTKRNRKKSTGQTEEVLLLYSEKRVVGKPRERLEKGGRNPRVGGGEVEKGGDGNS